MRLFLLEKEPLISPQNPKDKFLISLSKCRKATLMLVIGKKGDPDMPKVLLVKSLDTGKNGQEDDDGAIS